MRGTIVANGAAFLRNGCCVQELNGYMSEQKRRKKKKTKKRDGAKA